MGVLGFKGGSKFRVYRGLGFGAKFRVRSFASFSLSKAVGLAGSELRTGFGFFRVV